MIGVRGTKLTVKFWNSKTDAKLYLNIIQVHINSEIYLQSTTPNGDATLTCGEL